MKVKLPYGKGNVLLELPEERTEIIEPKKIKESRSTNEILEKALNKPLGGEKLEEIVRGKRICALVADTTRKQPYKEQIEACAKKLKEANHIQYIITTGSHDPDDEGNFRIARFIENSAKKYHLHYGILIHDCEKPMEEVGITGRGTKVEVDKETLDADLFLVTANMKNHYFAGYSNVVKHFLPGCCSFRTIEMNHGLALEPEATFGRHPWHPDLKRKTNPVAEDMLETMQLIAQGRPIYTLATIGAEKLIWAAAGDAETVTREGIKIVDQTTSFKLQPQKYIIVSPGGHPYDETLYAAQRGVDLTKNAVLAQGEILWLAACNGGYQGLGPAKKTKEFFYDPLTLDKPKNLLAVEVKKNYRLYKQKAYKMAYFMGKVSKIWLYSELDDNIVEAAHLYLAKNPQEIVNQWIKNDPQGKILVFKQANKLAIYASNRTEKNT
ncbi:DUF2088 domain-containing protein [Candidatus Aerophobetes bacterium]|uniref:DUF2088 domain-containing protein n=1 Tax=Aerophobetes bacterium TaxID=2030807 RepID=A0A523RWL4_UNCAE|nr:MAG: DUF2088 domain-containing protein [Candidatus Aerophobetes bacterium]